MFLNKKEIDIKPPKFPLTIAVNGAITDFYFNWFMSGKIPPGYSWVISSDYRDPIKNKEVGGAANSSHLHNLGRDFIVLKDGVKLGASQLKDFYTEYIDNKWNGYSYVSDKHIHVNLSRRINTASNVLAISVIGILGITVFTTFKEAVKSGRK